MKRFVGRAITMIATVLLVLTALAATQASAASPFTGKQGIGMGGISFRDTPAAQQAAAAKIAGLGAKWVRLEADWWYIQDGGKTSFNWAGLDSAVSAARAKSLNILLLIQKTPRWARTTLNGSTPPTNPADYATFAAQAVARYTPQGVTNYEVWNEPNLSVFWADPSTGKPNLQGYVNMLKAAYPKMKAATTTPINVISAGLSPYGGTGQAPDGSAISPLTYLQQMYAAGAKPYFDHVGWHPYTAPILPNDQKNENAWQQMSQDFTLTNGTKQKSARTIMTENGDGAKLIIMTEAGGPTFGQQDTFFTEAQQAQSYQQSITARAAANWAGPIFFYTLNDTAAYPTSNPDRENYFGVYKLDGTAKPVVSVLQSVQ